MLKAGLLRTCQTSKRVQRVSSVQFAFPPKEGAGSWPASPASGAASRPPTFAARSAARFFRLAARERPLLVKSKPT